MYLETFYLTLCLLLLTRATTAFSPFQERRLALVAKREKKDHSHPRRHHPAADKTSTSLRTTAQLIFKGDYVATSEKLPQDTTQQDIADFFAKLENRNIFLSAGGKRPLSLMDMTPEIKGYWEDICEHFQSKALPNDKDTLIAVDTEVKFPGVKLVTTSVSGVKEIYTDDNKRMLRGMEVLLVAEKSEGQGLKPMVWLFNKLTGYDKREKGVFYPPKQSKARSIVTAQPLPDDPSSLALTFTLQMQVTVEFPAALMKILPSSKEKMEEQGTSSILKTISKDVDVAMQAAYDKFMEERSSSSVETS